MTSWGSPYRLWRPVVDPVVSGHLGEVKGPTGHVVGRQHLAPRHLPAGSVRLNLAVGRFEPVGCMPEEDHPEDGHEVVARRQLGVGAKVVRRLPEVRFELLDVVERVRHQSCFPGDQFYARRRSPIIRAPASGLRRRTTLCRIASMGLRLSHPALLVLREFLANPRAELAGADLMASTGVASGTLYPILIRLEREGVLSSEWEAADPGELGRPRRRFYGLTRNGAAFARQALGSLEGASRSVVPVPAESAS